MKDPTDRHPLQDDLDYVLARTAGWWEPLRRASLFITGGTGFFGRWLLETFAHVNDSLDLRARAVVLTRDPGAFARKAPALARHRAIHFVRGDICRFTAGDVRRELGAAHPGRFEYVVHAATDTSAAAWSAAPLRLVDTVVAGTRAALDFALETGAQRFLLTSSGAVYGRQPSDVTHVAEDYLGGPDCTQPAFAYGEGKRMAELLCACYHRQHGLRTLIARPFAFVGPFLPLDAHFAVGNFIRDALRGGPIRVAGDGTPWRSYLHAADLAVSLWAILLRGQAMRPYNLGSGDALTILDLAHVVGEVLGVPEPPQVACLPRKDVSASRYVPDVARVGTELGLSAGIPLRQAIEKTARWAADHDPCVRAAAVPGD